MKFQTVLKRYMKKHDLSATMASKILGISRRELLFWKAGTHQPPSTRINGLLKKMGLNSKGVKL